MKEFKCITLSKEELTALLNKLGFMLSRIIYDDDGMMTEVLNLANGRITNATRVLSKHYGYLVFFADWSYEGEEEAESVGIVLDDFTFVITDTPYTGEHGFYYNEEDF